MKLEVEFDDTPLRNVTENFNAIVNTAFRDFSNGIVARGKEWISPDKSGLHNRTGALRDSIRLQRFVQYAPNSGASATIIAGSSRVPYAAVHEYGTIIRPTRAPYLTFKVNGRWVRVSQVRIPARPYLKPAYEEILPEFDTYLQKAMNEILERVV